MNNRDQKLDKTLVVRITSEQYTKLLETIISEQKKGKYSPLKPAEKSRVIRDMIDRFTLVVS